MGKPTGSPDTEKPTTPATVRAQVSGTNVILTWTRATDNVRVAGYRVYRNGVLIRDTARRTFTDEGLAVSTEYSYHITAYDGAGNESGASVTVKAKTPDGWSIDKLDVTLDRNREGAITGGTLGIRAVIGAGIGPASLQPSYTKRWMTRTTEQVRTIDLGNAGTAWNGLSEASRVYEIRSGQGDAAYQNGAVVAERAAEGFPCLIASSVSIALTVSNAPFAKAAAGNMQIVLRGKQRNATYTLPVLTESETNFYSFDGLSAGTYTLSVLKDGRTVYEVDKITVAAEADRVLPPHTISGFVRFKSPYGTTLLYTPARLSDGYSVDENGYLTNGEDSAFWYSGGTVRFYRVCEEYCEVEGGFYRMPQYQNITLNDSKEYTLAPLSGFDLLQAQRIRFRFSLASGKSLAGLSVQVSTMGDYRKTVTLRPKRRGNRPAPEARCRRIQCLVQCCRHDTVFRGRIRCGIPAEPAQILHALAVRHGCSAEASATGDRNRNHPSEIQIRCTSGRYYGHIAEQSQRPALLQTGRERRNRAPAEGSNTRRLPAQH